MVDEIWHAYRSFMPMCARSAAADEFRLAFPGVQTVVKEGINKKWQEQINGGREN